jgi:hypothetical protein
MTESLASAQRFDRSPRKAIADGLGAGSIRANQPITG